ncbi:MAG: trypsin-like peptidase domain-containing protein, partial [Candidatus Dormibacteraeota bacterium]|nr:trypsin-like peptidase domain-containing protein [Candidatus Dormibacteraeota bacterium]MBO0759827.1 trypsin-like peptidase domain-containing protein [Candidatus Dormibacteraeota bacterium]
AIAVVAGVALLAAGGGIGVWGATHLGDPSASPIQVSPQGNGSSGSSSLQSAASKVEPAIVDIDTTLASARGSSSAAGTGIILTSSGEVLTNNHVVEGATSLNVAIEGHGTHPAKVLGVDPTRDVALIQVQGVSGLPTAKLADSSSLQTGQSVAVLGNACGQGDTQVTTGQITGVNQSVTAQDDTGSAENLTGMVGIDASIVPGDSGGAIVNSSGQVVAMTTAGNGGDNACGNSGGGLQGSFGPPGSGTLPGGGSSGSSGGAQVPGQVPGGSDGSGGSGGQASSTTGYGVPANTAASVVNQIRTEKWTSEVLPGETGFLGVEGQTLTQAAAAQLGLSVDSGVLIVGFADSSPAQDAGIPQNSVITAVAGDAVSSTQTLQQQLAQHKPGDRVTVSWTDASGSHSSTVTLGTGPAA